jgi:hypothetical protein
MHFKLMPAILKFAVLAILLAVFPSRCFAAWDLAIVDKQLAKELDMEIRSTAAGPKHVLVELDFKADGSLKAYNRVELRIGERDEPLLTATLKEDKSKPGRVVVSIYASRTQLDKITLRVFVPETLGGSIYEVPLKDFVDVEKLR